MPSIHSDIRNESIQVSVNAIAFELELFEKAKNWKTYWARSIAKYVSGSAVEVGAGIGVNATYLLNSDVKKLMLLEPDPGLFWNLSTREFPENVDCASTVVQEVEEVFDTVIYIDVLEHIELDRQETTAAYSRMSIGAHLVILAPALPFLYSPFDRAVGHYRRYTKASLREAIDPRLETVSEFYLDSIGLFASLANKLCLRASAPSLKQVEVWDRLMVPVSRIVDKLLFYSVGKTVVGVYRKT